MALHYRFDEQSVGIARCQSPLETKLVHALASVVPFEWRQPDSHHWEIGRWNGWMLALLSQPVYGRYRADLGICTWAYDGDSPPFILVLEVDGHDYHERTKEQARKDKERDRFMTTTGAKILRFTGSEVYADAEACAHQIMEYAISLQEPHLTEQFKAFVKQQHASLPNAGDA